MPMNSRFFQVPDMHGDSDDSRQEIPEPHPCWNKDEALRESWLLSSYGVGR